MSECVYSSRVAHLVSCYCCMLHMHEHSSHLAWAVHQHSKFNLVCADLLGFFGAFGFAPMTFWMPSVIWLVVMKPSKKSWDFWLNVLNIVVFVIIMFLAAIGSIYSIIQDAKTYKFYQ